MIISILAGLIDSVVLFVIVIAIFLLIKEKWGRILLLVLSIPIIVLIGLIILLLVKFAIAFL